MRVVVPESMNTSGEMHQSHTTRKRLPFSLTLRQASVRCGSDGSSDSCGSTDGGFGLEYLRGPGPGGVYGGGGNTSDTICLEGAAPGGTLSHTRLTSMRLGTITVPSSLRVQPPAASSTGHRTKAANRPNISNTPCIL